MSFFARLVGKKQNDGDKDKQAQTAQQDDDDSSTTIAASGVAPARGIGGLPRMSAPADASAQSASATAAAAAAASAVSSIAGPSVDALPSVPSSGSVAPAGSAAASGPPMPNMSSCCPAEKWRYESCFQKWYTAEFLTGKSTDLSACQPMFEQYRSCVISYYEKNEPEFLVLAGATSDHLLVEGGSQAFGTKYPNLDKDKDKKEKENK